MMAPGHALSGLVAGLGTVGVVSGRPVAEQAGWVLLWSGAALANDLDAQGTTVTRMWGPVSGGVRVRFFRRGKRRTIVPGVTDILGTLVGGHREGSHSVVGFLGLLVVVWLATFWTWGTALVAAFCLGLMLAAVGVILPGRQPQEYWPINLGLCIAAGAYVVTHHVTLPGWVPFALAGGAAIHILGDMITVTGCPLGWPVDRKRVSVLPLRANGPVCCWLITPALAFVAFCQSAQLAGYHPWSAIWTALTTFLGNV